MKPFKQVRGGTEQAIDFAVSALSRHHSFLVGQENINKSVIDLWFVLNPTLEFQS